MGSDIQLQDPSLYRTQCYVGGQWTEAETGASFSVTNPATTHEIALCPECDANDATNAINIAAKALPVFRKCTPHQRSNWLRKWHELMMDNIDDLARLITLENGKPLADARTEVAYAAGFFEWFAGEALRIYGDTITPSNPSHRLVTLRQPIGVCTLIAPWNFPAAMITRKVGPALAAGCTVVVKAAGETPLTALALVELAHRAGIPAGVVNVITTLKNTPEVGRALTTHQAVKKVSFTGSTAVGRALMCQSASTVKKLSMELGGNAPFIVFEDADLDAAVDGLISSKFRISGQTCVCANRIFVQEKIHDDLVAKLVDRVRRFKIGNGLDKDVTHGPLVHDRAVQKVREHVNDAVGKGAKLLFGGSALDELGPNFFNITILTQMSSEMRICTEETFGPVAAIFGFKNEEEVIHMANNTEMGLGGYFFSKDVRRCWRVAEALEVGMVGVNTGVISDPVAPFGGIKQSGFGREGSKYGIDEFLVTKTVMFGIE